MQTDRHSDSTQSAPPENRYDVMVAFQNADEDRKGYLSAEDLKIAFVALFGYKPSKEEVRGILAKEEDQEIPGISLKTFMDISLAKIAAQDVDDQIRQVFVAFDMGCRGFITLDDAKKTFGQIAPFLDPTRVEKAFREIDSDQDGRVSYRDFEFMMKYSVD